jgi:hypothetical protein
MLVRRFAAAGCLQRGVGAGFRQLAAVVVPSRGSLEAAGCRFGPPRGRARQLAAVHTGLDPPHNPRGCDFSPLDGSLRAASCCCDAIEGHSGAASCSTRAPGGGSRQLAAKSQVRDTTAPPHEPRPSGPRGNPRGLLRGLGCEGPVPSNDDHHGPDGHVPAERGRGSLWWVRGNGVGAKRARLRPSTCTSWRTLQPSTPETAVTPRCDRRTWTATLGGTSPGWTTRAMAPVSTSGPTSTRAERMT